MTRYRADWLLPISDDPDSRRLGRRRRRSHHRRRRTGEHESCAWRDRPWPRGHPAGARQRAHASRAVVPARTRSAGTTFSEWVRTLMALRRQYPDPSAPEILSAARDGDRRGAGHRHRAARRRQQHAGDRPAAARRRHGRRRCFTSCSGSTSPTRPRASAAAARGARPTPPAPDDRRRAHRRLRRMRRIPCRRRCSARFARSSIDAAGTVTSVHLGESADEVEFLRARDRRLHGAAARSSACGPRTGRPPGTSPVGYLSDLGFLDRRALVGARRPVRRRRPLAAAGARRRRSCRAREATSTSASARRRSRRSTRWTSTWRSAPTASPAWPI